MKYKYKELTKINQRVTKRDAICQKPEQLDPKSILQISNLYHFY